MRKLLLVNLLVLLISVFLTSCEKPEQPVSLPPKSGSQHTTVNMGEDYTDQIFYDLYSNEVVYTSKVNSWDIALEASPQGYHVFVNGGKNIFVYNTHKTDMKEVVGIPNIKDEEWTGDGSCGLPDSTAISDWKAGRAGSKNEVYILKFDPSHIADTFRKIQLLSVSDDRYVFSYSDLKHPYGQTITVPKDDKYNYVYYSFQEDRVSYPEPPKNTWDIVFTRYRVLLSTATQAIYPYIVSGALLNPNNTTAAIDSLTPYQNLKAENVPALKFSNHRDIIGYAWKVFSLTGGYTVNPAKVYVIKTRDDRFYKMHFLSFYNNQGIKGSPGFEHEQLK